MSKNKQKVVFLYENAGDDTDAVAIAMLQLCNGLAAQGMDSTVHLPRWKRKNSGSMAQKLLGQCAFLLLAGAFLFRPRLTKRTIVTLDVPSGLGLICHWASKITMTQITHVSWVMDLYRFKDQESQKATISGVQRTIDAYGLKKSKNVVVIGSCMHMFLRRELGVSSTVIPIWQDPAGFTTADPEKVQEFRRQHGLDDKFVVVYSGTAREIHPLQGVLEAAVRTQGDDRVAYLIVGRGTEIDWVRSRVAELRLQNIQVLDYRPLSDVPVIATMAGIHVVSLAKDATGTCVPSKGYSAMAAGKPVLYIGSQSGQLAEDIIRCDGGHVADSDSVDAMVDYIRTMASSFDAANTQGANAQSFFLGHRTPEVGAAAWSEFIESL